MEVSKFYVHGNSADYIVVEEPTEFIRFAKQWKKRCRVAIDTEFVTDENGERKLCVLQVRDGHNPIYLCRFSIPAMQTERAKIALKQFLSSKCIKILHDCRQDVVVLHSFCNGLTKEIFDTQIALQCLPEQFGNRKGIRYSYPDTVEMILGISIPKDKDVSASMWDAAVLSKKQEEYAALDVLYLYDVYAHLVQKLEAGNDVYDPVSKGFIRLIAVFTREVKIYETTEYVQDPKKGIWTHPIRQQR